MARYVLSARIREVMGKEAAKKLRREHLIPTNFYGPDSAPLMLTIQHSDMQKIMKQAAGKNTIFDLEIETENGNNTKIVMLKELQADPIKDTYLHADFLEISMNKEITVNVPIHLLNVPVGVTDGGILQQIRREILISCMPDKLVDFLELDVSELEIGATLSIGDIELPEGLKFAQEEKLPIASVLVPKIVEEEEEEEEEEEGEAAEGEDVVAQEDETPEA